MKRLVFPALIVLCGTSLSRADEMRLLRLKPDIAVVSECADPQRLRARGIRVRALDNTTGTGMEIARIGHQTELLSTKGGAAGEVRIQSNGIGVQ